MKRHGSKRGRGERRKRGEKRENEKERGKREKERKKEKREKEEEKNPLQLASQLVKPVEGGINFSQLSLASVTLLPSFQRWKKRTRLSNQKKRESYFSSLPLPAKAKVVV